MFFLVESYTPFVARIRTLVALNFHFMNITSVFSTQSVWFKCNVAIQAMFMFDEIMLFQIFERILGDIANFALNLTCKQWFVWFSFLLSKTVNRHQIMNCFLVLMHLGTLRKNAQLHGIMDAPLQKISSDCFKKIAQRYRLFLIRWIHYYIN